MKMIFSHVDVAPFLAQRLMRIHLIVAPGFKSGLAVRFN
jgi:hypothetical protein